MTVIPTCDDPSTMPELRNAALVLDRILGHDNFTQSAVVWTRVPGDNPAFRLTLKHQNDSASTDFTLDELRNKHYLQVSLARLWGDLLKVRNDRQHLNVQILSGQMVGTQEGN